MKVIFGHHLIFGQAMERIFGEETSTSRTKLVLAAREFAIPKPFSYGGSLEQSDWLKNFLRHAHNWSYCTILYSSSVRTRHGMT